MLTKAMKGQNVLGSFRCMLCVVMWPSDYERFTICSMDRWPHTDDGYVIPLFPEWWQAGWDSANNYAQNQRKRQTQKEWDRTEHYLQLTFYERKEEDKDNIDANITGREKKYNKEKSKITKKIYHKKIIKNNKEKS